MSKIYFSLFIGFVSYLADAQKLPVYFACHTTERCEYILREHQKEFSKYPIKIYDSCPKIKFSDNRKIVSIGALGQRALNCEQIHQSLIMKSKKYKKSAEKIKASFFSQTKTIKDYLFKPKSYEYYQTPRDQGIENHSGNCQSVFGMLNFGKDLRESNEKVYSRLRMAGLEDFGKFFMARAKVGGELNKVNQNSYWELVRAAGIKSLLTKYKREYGQYPRGINEKACTVFKDALPKSLFLNPKKELTAQDKIKIESEIKTIEIRIKKENKLIRSLSSSIFGKINFIATGTNSKILNAKRKVSKLKKILSQKKKFLKEGKISLIDNLVQNSENKRSQLVSDADLINKLSKKLKEQKKILSKKQSTLRFLQIGSRRGQSYSYSYIRKTKANIEQTQIKTNELKKKIHDVISRNKVFALDRSKGLWSSSDWDEDELIEDNPWLKSFLNIKDHNSEKAKKLTELAIIREEKELRKAIYSFCQIPSDSFRSNYIGTTNTNNNSCTDFDNSYPGFESDLKEYAFNKEQIKHICEFKYEPFTPYQLAKFESLNKTVLEAYPTLNQYYQCMSEYADKDQQTMLNLEIVAGLGCLAASPFTGLTLTFACTFSLEAPLVVSNFSKTLDHLEYHENCFLTQKECTPEMIKKSNDSFNEQTIAMILVILGEPVGFGIDTYNIISKYNKLLAKKTRDLEEFLEYFKEPVRKKFLKELEDIKELSIPKTKKIKLLNKLMDKAIDEKLLTKIKQILFHNNNDITTKLIDDHLRKLGLKNRNQTFLNYSKIYELAPENVLKIIKYSRPNEIISNLEKARTDLIPVLTKLYSSEYFHVIQTIESVSRKFPNATRRSINVMSDNAKRIAFAKKYPSKEQYVYEVYEKFIPDENIVEQIISAKEKYSIPYEEVIRIYSQNTKPYIPSDLNGVNVYKSDISLEDFSAIKGEGKRVYKAKELIEEKLSQAKKHIEESNEFIRVLYEHLYSKSKGVITPNLPKLYKPINPGLEEAINILTDTTLEYSILGSPYKYLDDEIYKGHRIAKRRMLLTEAENLKYILERFPEFKERIINALNKIDYTEISITEILPEDILIDGYLKSDFLRSQMSDLLNSKIINVPDDQLKEKFDTILSFIENPERHGTVFDPNKHIFIDNNIITYKRKGKSPKRWLLDYFETQKQKEAIYSPGVYIESIVKVGEPIKLVKRDKSIIKEEQFLEIINELHNMSIGGHPERYYHSDNLPILNRAKEFTDKTFESGYMDQKIFAEYLASTPKGVKPPPIFITDDKDFVRDLIIGQFLPKIEDGKVLWRDDTIFNWNKLGTSKEKFEKLRLEFKEYFYSMSYKPYPQLHKLRALNDQMIKQLKSKISSNTDIFDDLLKEFDPDIHINPNHKKFKSDQYQKRYPCGITLKVAGRYMKIINPEIDKDYFLEHCN